MKSDIVLRIEKALKEYTPSKIDGVRIATARGILTAYEIAVKNGLSEAGEGRLYKSLRKLYAAAYNLRYN